MNKFNLKLANQIISVICQYDYTARVCGEYIVNSGNSIFTVFATDDEITTEINNADVSVDAGYAEFICLYRKIAELLPHYNCVVMHGAAITYENSAILFVAPSGTGKSTHIKLWRQVFLNEVEIINGDKPIVSISDQGIVIFGTPWAGKENWHKNIRAPLKAICILKQAKQNHIEKIDPQAYLSQLLKQMYLPVDAISLKQTLQLFDTLIKKIPIYILECNISQEAVKIAHDAILEKLL